MGYFHADVLSVGSPLDALLVTLPGPGESSIRGNTAGLVLPRAASIHPSPCAPVSPNRLPIGMASRAPVLRPAPGRRGGLINDPWATSPRPRSVGPGTRSNQSRSWLHSGSNRIADHDEADRHSRSIYPEMRRQS